VGFVCIPRCHQGFVLFYLNLPMHTYTRVNVDIDVPLFLPLYGQRRQHDLRRLALRELREGFRMDGQMNFDSGWEWGYWLSDMVTARASWDPYLAVAPEASMTNSGTCTGGNGVADNQKGIMMHHIGQSVACVHYSPPCFCCRV
jgi:hypothetical protein